MKMRLNKLFLYFLKSLQAGNAQLARQIWRYIVRLEVEIADLERAFLELQEENREFASPVWGSLIASILADLVNVDPQIKMCNQIMIKFWFAAFNIDFSFSPPTATRPMKVEKKEYEFLEFRPWAINIKKNEDEEKDDIRGFKP